MKVFGLWFQAEFHSLFVVLLSWGTMNGQGPVQIILAFNAIGCNCFFAKMPL